MATPGDYLDAADLAAIDAGGFINEDLMQEIQDSSEGIKPVLLDMIPTVPVSNSHKTWLEDELEAPTDSSVISGADATVANQTMPNAARVGNHAQTNVKVVAVSERAQNVDTAGMSSALDYRTRRKLLELKRDVEYRFLGNQASVADTGDAVKGVTAGLGAWIATNSYSGTGGAPGGYDPNTGLVAAPTVGYARSISLDLIRDAVKAIYDAGGGENGLVLMSVPGVIKEISEALRTDGTYNFVSPVANISGTQAETQVAQGWTDQAITDFGIRLKLVPNRLQPTYTSAGGQDVANLYILDTNYLAKGFLHDFKVEPLAKVGLSHRRLLSVDWMTVCKLERVQAVIRDIDIYAAYDPTYGD